MPGSIIEGITMSMYGLRENSPYFASSYARSRYSTLGLIEIAPRRCGPTPGQAGEVRQLGEREIHLARRAAEPEAANLLDEVGRQLLALDELEERAPRIEAGDDDGRVISSPFSSTTPVARPSLHEHLRTGASVRISAPNARAALAIARLTEPLPPFAKPHARNAPSISPM